MKRLLKPQMPRSGKGLSDRWLLPLLNTTQQPALLSPYAVASTRENLFAAGWKRNRRAMRMILSRAGASLAEIRARKAELLGDGLRQLVDGRPNGGNARGAFAFMRRIAPAARARAERELADINS